MKRKTKKVARRAVIVRPNGDTVINVGDRVAVINRHTGQPGAIIGTVIELFLFFARVQASKSEVVSQWPLKRLVVPAESVD